MWHASVANCGGKKFDNEQLHRFALGALAGVGDVGNQFEEWNGYAFHLRRLVNREERQLIGEPIDCRGTDEAKRRLEEARPFLPASAIESAITELLSDIEGMRLENLERPNNPFILGAIGWELLKMGQPTEALPCLQESLALLDYKHPYCRNCLVMIAECHTRLGQIEKALDVCREGLQHFPTATWLLDLELRFTNALAWPTYVVSMT